MFAAHFLNGMSSNEGVLFFKENNPVVIWRLFLIPRDGSLAALTLALFIRLNTHHVCKGNTTDSYRHYCRRSYDCSHRPRI